MRLHCWTQLLRSLILGWLLTTLLCELNCARSGTKFLIAHVLVVVVAKWAWYTMTCYLSEGMMLARKNPLNTLNGPSHHLPSIFVLSFIIVHRIQLITESQLLLSSMSSLLTLKQSFSPKSIVGDLNIHDDVSHDPHWVKLLDLLKSVGLQQYITEPTQIQGHTRDHVIQCLVILLIVGYPGKRPWRQASLSIYR